MMLLIVPGSVAGVGQLGKLNRHLVALQTLQQQGS
jgi:hypothetical protein